jgi:hypothetical protein
LRELNERCGWFPPHYNQQSKVAICIAANMLRQLPEKELQFEAIKAAQLLGGVCDQTWMRKQIVQPAWACVSSSSAEHLCATLQLIGKRIASEPTLFDSTTAHARRTSPPHVSETGCIANFIGPPDTEPWAPLKLGKLLDGSETKDVAIAASTAVIQLANRLDCSRHTKEARSAVLGWLGKLTPAELLSLGNISPPLRDFYNASGAMARRGCHR